MKKLSHYDSAGGVHMVDVSGKPETRRTARAHAFVRIGAAVLRKLPQNPKGNPLEIARIAGIAAAKRTAELIPLCHSLPLDGVEMRFTPRDEGIFIEAEVRTQARTGVEMEALTAVCVAALTVYDMCKAVDKGMVIGGVRLVRKIKE